MNNDNKNEVDDYIIDKLKTIFTNVEKKYIYKSINTLMVKDDLNLLLEHCSRIGVTDINIEGGKHIMGDIRKKMYPLSAKKITNGEASVLLKKIYDENATVRIDSILDIDTKYSMKLNGEVFRYRVNGVGTTVGSDKTVQITIRTLSDIPPKLKIINRGDKVEYKNGFLTLEKDIWESFKPVQGMVLVTGPTGSGKSTLLASGIREILENPDSNTKIITYESPIEYVYNKCAAPSSFISQTEIGTQLGTFGLGVINAMRRAPKIILIGEVRDPETVSSAIEASQTGHLVYSTAHTKTVSESLKRLINIFPENERQSRMMDLIDTIEMIISQRIIKTSNGGVCAVKEFLIFDDEVKKVLRNTNQLFLSKVLDEIVKDKRQRLIDDIYLRHLEGLLTEEDFKVCEKEYGKLNLSDDDIFNFEDDEIKYLYTRDFNNLENLKNHHCGLIINLGSNNHGKIAYIPNDKMDIKTFSLKTNAYVYKNFSDLNYTNKDIILELKILYEEKNKKNDK